MSAESEVPLEGLPRRFVRHVLSFFVGLGIGLAPFLGTKNIPGFKALISVMPFQIKSELITLSAFLMGLIVVAVQFYSAERISRPALVKRFGLALAAMGIGFILFYHLRNEFTVDVERGSTTVTVLIGSVPKKTKSCDCKNPADEPETCIKTLSFNAEAIAACWDYREIRRRGELLGFSYLILTGGVALLIGFILLQEEARRQAKKKKARPPGKKPSRPRRAAPKAPAAGEAPGSPEPPPQDEPPPADTP